MVEGPRVVGVILSTLVAVVALSWEVKPWEWFQDDPPERVKLVGGHAAAFAKNQWEADLRVVNDTSEEIVVERVTATFGGRHYGSSTRAAPFIWSTRPYSRRSDGVKGAHTFGLGFGVEPWRG